MVKLFSALACLALLALGVGACASKPVYTPNVFIEKPKISVIAVAPFLVTETIATQTSQPFASGNFLTSDRAVAWYSVAFAKEFADGLTNFPGITIIQPDVVFRAWRASVGTADVANPMATADQARKIGAALKADAIIVAEVLEWDPFTPSLTLDWKLLYCGTSKSGSGDILTLERAGHAGGGEVSEIDLSRQPVYEEQIMLNADHAQVKEALEWYGESMTTIDPYKSGAEAVMARPFPYFVRFASWRAMRNAFRAWGAPE